MRVFRASTQEPTTPKKNPNAHRTIGKVITVATSLGVILGFNLLPLVERYARAEEPPAPTTTERLREVKCAVEGRQIRIIEGSEIYDAYLCYGSKGIKCVATLNGPATLIVLFYPIVLRDQFADGTPKPQQVFYTIDDIDKVYDGNTSLSAATVNGVGLKEKLGIGTPIEMTLSVEEGEHTFSISAPNGLLRIMKVESTYTIPPPLPSLVAPEKSKVQTREKEVPLPTLKKPRESSDSSLLYKVLERVGLRYREIKGMGRADNWGEFTEVRALFNIWSGERVGFLLGGQERFYNLGSRIEDATINVGVQTEAAVVGFKFSDPSHSLTLLGSVGARRISPDINTIAFEDNWGYTLIQPEFGCEGEYHYVGRVRTGVLLRGSNNPANPGLAEAYVDIPYGWVRGAYPRLVIGAEWLHLIEASPSEERYATSISDRVILSHVTGEIPLFSVGPVIINAILGLELEGADLDTMRGRFGGSESTVLSGAENGGGLISDTRSRLLVNLYYHKTY